MQSLQFHLEVGKLLSFFGASDRAASASWRVVGGSVFRFLHTSTRLCGWVYVPSHLIVFMNQFWLRYMCSCAAWEQDLFFHSRVLVLRPACSHIVSGMTEWLEQQHLYAYGVHLRRQCRKPGSPSVFTSPRSIVIWISWRWFVLWILVDPSSALPQ